MVIYVFVFIGNSTGYLWHEWLGRKFGKVIMKDIKELKKVKDYFDNKKWRVRLLETLDLHDCFTKRLEKTMKEGTPYLKYLKRKKEKK